jgi:hypothetical protein
MGMLYAIVPVIFIGSPIVLGVVGASSEKNKRPLLTAAAITLCAGLVITLILCFCIKMSPVTKYDVIDLFF